MGTLWIPGAERLHCSSPGGTITSTAPPHAVWHTTEADPGTSNVWTAMIRVLNNKGAEPQVLYDPVTDRLGQFMPLNVAGRALRNDGTTRTNRVGKVCIQIEVIGRSAKPFTDTWKPGLNFRALMAAIRSWDIPDIWPAGPPPKFVQVGTGGYNVPENSRSRTTWTTKGGHFSHSQIPGNDHGDPGGISISALFAAAPKTTPKPTTDTGDDMPLTAADITAIRAAVQAELTGFRSTFRADVQAENEEYGSRLWALDTGTGKKLVVDVLADHTLRLQRIEDDTDDGTI